MRHRVTFEPPHQADRGACGARYCREVRGFVDVHSHVVPSGDDGAASIAEGLGLCRIAFDDGIRTLFATPHAHAPWDTYPRTAHRVDLFEASFPVLRDEVAAWGLDLRRGWEVYPTELLHGDPAEFVLEGTRGVLIEFPGSWLEIEDPLAVVAEAALIVEEAGLVPVLAHPERCRSVAHEPRSIRPFVERGWLVCLNAPSLVGRHGGTAERTAWRLLDEGLAGLAASDGHSVSRPPTLGEGFRAVRDQFGEDYALSLFDGSALPWTERQPSA